MMSVYNNLTDLKSATDMTDIWSFAETASGSIMSGSFLLAFFFVLLVGLKPFGFDKALASSSFVCFILGSYLAYAAVLNIIIPLAFLAICGFTMMYIIIATNQ